MFFNRNDIYIADAMIRPLLGARPVHISDPEQPITITPQGLLEGDRDYALVNPAGEVVYPWSEHRLPHLEVIQTPNGGIELHWGEKELEINPTTNNMRHSVKIGDETYKVPMLNDSALISAWLDINVFGQKYQLVKLTDEAKEALTRDQKIMVVLESTIAELGAKFRQNSLPQHFQPNITLSGAPAYTDAAMSIIGFGTKGGGKGVMLKTSEGDGARAPARRGRMTRYGSWMVQADKSGQYNGDQLHVGQVSSFPHILPEPKPGFARAKPQRPKRSQAPSPIVS